MSSMQYSKLCDTNVVAYLAYLSATAVRDGKRFEQPVCVSGGDCVDAGGSGRNVYGSAFVDVYSGLLGQTRRWTTEMDACSSSSVFRGRIDCIAGSCAGRSENGDVGLADGDDGHRVSGVAGGVCAESGRDVGNRTRVGSKPGLPVEELVDTGSVVHARTLRNRELREKKKKRKQRKQEASGASRVDPVVSDVPEWRRGKPGAFAGFGLGRNGKPVKPDGVGFWKSCDEETLQDLVKSKARMHIANNVRKAKEDEARVQYLDSPQALADRAMDMIAAAQKKAEKLNDDKVVGWARTVTQSSAESLARSVPSTVPSFDSFSSAVDEAASVEKKAQVDQELALVCADLELLKKDNDELREKNRVLSVRAAVSPPAALKLSSDKKQPGETTQQHFERVKRMGIISANFRY